MYIVLTTSARIVLAAVFIFSGVMKLIKQDEFIESLAQLSFLHTSWFPLVGILIPVVEIILAILLTVGFFTKMVSLSAAGLILVFTAVYVPVLIDPSANAQCACFGVSSDINIWFVVRNALLFGIAFFLFTQDEFWYSLDRLRKKK